MDVRVKVRVVIGMKVRVVVSLWCPRVAFKTNLSEFNPGRRRVQQGG